MKAVIIFQGFTESDERPTGMEDLYFSVIRQFAGPYVTTYQPRRWNSCTTALAHQLVRQRIHDVIVVAYSWGAGYAAMKFAKVGRQFGIRIPLALLCDPVYRPTWMPAWLPANPLNIYSLDRRSKIKLPTTIRRIAGVRQQLTIPHGHEVVRTDPNQIVPQLKVLPYSHTGIDESPEWFALVKNELEYELKNP
jgi:pimeloyl-ACP methyl ester carboxylesterase